MKRRGQVLSLLAAAGREPRLSFTNAEAFGKKAPVLPARRTNIEYFDIDMTKRKRKENDVVVL